MIKFRLICKDCEITFDSWFSSSNEYEKLKKKNFLICYICSSLNIEKAIMSPSIFVPNDDYKIEKQIQKQKETKKIISKYQDYIKKNFYYVGENFAYEARSAHYQKKKGLKGFYGTATKNDLKELREEGIEAEIIPWIKDNMN